MEKRVLIAVLLMGATIMLTNLLFPPAKQAPPAAEAPAAVAPAAPAAAAVSAALREAAPAQPARTIVVSSPLYRYSISTRGAAVVGAELLKFDSYLHNGTKVQLVPEGAPGFLSHRVAIGRDTLDLRAAPFTAEVDSLLLAEGSAPRDLTLVFTGANGVGAEVTYTFRPDDYLIGVKGRLTGVNATGAQLLTELGPTIAPHEAPDHRSEQQLSVVGHTAPKGNLERVRMAKVKGTETIAGPLDWVAMRDKYFLAAVLTPEQQPFADAQLRALPSVRVPASSGKDTLQVPQVQVTAAQPLAADGTFAYDVYLGPQEYGRLSAIGHDLEEVTPYSYQWLQPIIRPIAAAVIWVLETLHHTLGWSYGWVLVLFGVLMRVVLWPLNAKAMRAQMKNMGVQPLMQEIREKYKNDPVKQQEELMKLYREHGFNPMAGCLPMLIPFPVLITLFFVFQNSIAFRGEQFLWLPDLSLKDPFYILPILVVGSMFALQWLSAKLSGMEQNPQMKTMMYVMPLMMGIIFFNLPSGLNLYYATTNLATMPQQILISKERRRVQEELKKKGPPKKK